MLMGSLDAVLSAISSDKEYSNRSFPFIDTLVAFGWLHAVDQALYSHTTMIMPRKLKTGMKHSLASVVSYWRTSIEIKFEFQ